MIPAANIVEAECGRGTVSFLLEDFIIARLRLKAIQMKRGKRELQHEATIVAHRQHMLAPQ